MPEFSFSNKNKIFHHEIIRGDLIQYERICIDFVPQPLATIINDILDETIRRITSHSTREDLEEIAKTASNYVLTELPFNEFRTGEEYMQAGEPDDLFYQNYLLNSPHQKPHQLSDLCESGMLNCVGQSLAIKEVLGSTKWGIYALYGPERLGDHHILATIQNEYCVRIDSVAGARREDKEPGNQHIYSFNKNEFYRRYGQTPFLNQVCLKTKHQ